jgi:hypothetical protein
MADELFEEAIEDLINKYGIDEILEYLVGVLTLKESLNAKIVADHITRAIEALVEDIESL